MLGGYGSALLIKKEWDHLEQLGAASFFERTVTT
jgi:hypothetical protein